MPKKPRDMNETERFCDRGHIANLRSLTGGIHFVSQGRYTVNTFVEEVKEHLSTEVFMKDPLDSVETHGNVKPFLPSPYMQSTCSKVGMLGMSEGVPVCLAVFTQPLCLCGKSKFPEISSAFITIFKIRLAYFCTLF
ncbi:hypothetical protein E2C01_049959 [Portunus trituberculatus]|uniref:Uncharacterized protein n=1 Tax=Portunus trituberculatus TaxID=210409 RepID=A0A5B7G6Z7_PORTR|nr:hypothetical protein [Portunus trituberculatus]